jgi:hypothetical protein
MASIRFGLVCECKAKKWVVKLARIDHKSFEIGDRYGLRHSNSPSGACRTENSNAILKGKLRNGPCGKLDFKIAQIEFTR